MKLKDLKKEIPYQWRVQSFSKFKPTATCVAYIDARDVMNILDEVIGEENWQDDYKLIDGKLLAGIGIKTDSGVVWKWDTGTESDTEAEKGQMSDAFKRAGVKWGIGRFLYNLDIRTVNTDGAKTDSHKYPKVIDAQGKPVYNISEHINSMKGKVAPTANTVPNKAIPPKKALPLDMQIKLGIERANNVAELEVIATGIKNTPKLTDIEKQSLTALVDMKAMDFEDVEITPDTVPFNN